MIINNPILSGFYPDPSICRKGSDYYLVTSTFEYFPGVPVFHSTDLVNWRQIGNCLTRQSQLDLAHVKSSQGIYAPTIRYNPFDDYFYMVTTNVTKGNFFVKTKNPAGEWSEPIFVAQGGIDPSLFFEEDGTAHFISNARKENVRRAGFLMASIDLETGKFLKEAVPVWGGIGANAPEAPHIVKKDGYYYQILAEGGTELGHMVTIARSRELYGTYEACPNNPILSHKDCKGHEIQATGHADFVEDASGNWWAVFLGYRQTMQYFHHLGRETFLAPVEWVEDWPVINGGNPITRQIELPNMPEVAISPTKRYYTDFAQPELGWLHLRNPEPERYVYGNGVSLLGNEFTLCEQENACFLGYRQGYLEGETETVLSFTPCQNGEEAGISVYYQHDAHFDLCVSRENGENRLRLRLVVGEIIHTAAQIPWVSGEVRLKIEYDKLQYRFSAEAEGGKVFLGTAASRHVSTEAHKLGFTGVLFALYATGNGRGTITTAVFKEFCVQGK